MARDYDVIVIGTGVAGHCAALGALEDGARVLMVEAEDKIGGSSRLSTGMLMGAGTRLQRASGITEDSAELFFRHYMAVNHWQVQPSVARRLCFEAGPTIDWLEQRGVELLEVRSSGSEEFPRGHVTRGGSVIVDTLHGRCQGFDRLDVAVKTRVTRLLTKDGTVTGIATGDAEVSAGAVVLATGGMGADLEMVRRWQPLAFTQGAQPPRYLGAAGARGDAVRFADQVDAQMALGIGLLTPIWSFGGGYLPHFIFLVNALGRRFMNETWAYGAAESIFAAQPGSVAYAVFDDATKQAMRARADVEREMTVLPGEEQQAAMFIGTAVDDLVTQGLIVKADTLEQLAFRLNLPQATFLGAAARYNRQCANGHDDDYLKKAKLRPVSTPPYYAFTLKMAGFALTTSGIRIDHNASVLHRTNEPIPGLFAGGECAGGVIVRAYVGSGNELANASTFGRLAGRHAAAFALTGALPPVDWASLGLGASPNRMQAAP